MASTINKFCGLVLELADLADSERDTPFGKTLSNSLGMGCATFSQKMRAGIQSVIDLLDLCSRREYSLSWRKNAMDSYNEFMLDVFGTEIDVDLLTEEERIRLSDAVRDVVKEILREDEDDSNQMTLYDYVESMEG